MPALEVPIDCSFQHTYNLTNCQTTEQWDVAAMKICVKKVRKGSTWIKYNNNKGSVGIQLILVNRLLKLQNILFVANFFLQFLGWKNTGI